MKFRIITHGGCTDGYASAFIVKKYTSYFLPEHDSSKIDITEVRGLQPKDIQLGLFRCQKNDLVLDLPQPKEKVLLWCDHHSTSEPSEGLPEHYYWKKTPSCAGYLLDLAVQKKLPFTKDLQEFKNAIDIMDSAAYSKNDIMDCFYPKRSYDHPSILLRLHMIGTMFHTKDPNLNDEIFRTLLSGPLGETPLEGKQLWDLNPFMYYKAQLEGYKQWREAVDTFIKYNEESHCVVQDNREVRFIPGVPDRFYAYVKFPQSSYNLVIRNLDEKETQIALGSNIFHKDRCKIDVGSLCKQIGEKFGSGAGGGHYYVGGATISVRNSNKALEFILERMKEGEKG